MTRVAAIQLEPALGDVAANLAACERLADDAAPRGRGVDRAARVLHHRGRVPCPSSPDAALAPDGAATELLLRLARRHRVRRRLVPLPRRRRRGPQRVLPRARRTELRGPPRQGPADDVGELLLRRRRRRRAARGRRADRRRRAVLGVHAHPDRAPPARQGRRRRRRLVLVEHPALAAGRAHAAHGGVQRARRRRVARPPSRALVGAPVVHAAHAGPFECRMPGLPVLTYRGHFQGGALVRDARRPRARPPRAPGRARASRSPTSTPGRVAPLDPLPDRYWLHRPRPARGVHVDPTSARTDAAGTRATARGRPPLELAGALERLPVPGF